jgi:hypothetical protein
MYAIRLESMVNRRVCITGRALLGMLLIGQTAVLAAGQDEQYRAVGNLGGPPGAAVRARLCVALLAKGAAIACETRLDSHSHSGSECYRTFHLAH